MTTLYLDTETRSATPIKWGAHRYCADPEFAIRLIQYAIDDGPVRVLEWERIGVDRSHFLNAYNRAERIVAHGANFDWVVMARSGMYQPLERWDCTQARARAHALPGGLEVLCQIFRLPEATAKFKGKDVVKLFGIPRPEGTGYRWADEKTHPEEWRYYKEYAAQDIIAMRELDKKIPRWSWTDDERAYWRNNMAMNHRGMQIDTELCEAAIATIATAKKDKQKRADEITHGALNLTQRDRLIQFMLAYYEVETTDLRAQTIENLLDNEAIPDECKELLRLRLEHSRSSNAKWPAIRSAVVPSTDRLHDTSLFCGTRTGRPTGKVFQPLNLPRPAREFKKFLPEAISALRLRLGHLVVPDVMLLASSALRGALIAPEGKQLGVADFNAVEGRIAAHVTGEEWKIQAYRDADAGVGEEVYVVGAAGMFDLTPEAVRADHEAGGELRQLGKVGELAFQYGGAVGAWHNMAAIYGVEKTDAEAFALSRKWRAANPKTVEMWHMLEAVARSTINGGAGFRFDCGIVVQKRANWLTIRLPSGRYLSYASPREEWISRPCFDCDGSGIVADDDGTPGMCVACTGTGKRKQNSITFMGVHPKTKQWCRQATYGAKLFENIVQAIARDLLEYHVDRIPFEGYTPVLTIYDEIVAECDMDGSGEELAEIIQIPPPWLAGMPLKAVGFTTDRFRKD